MELEVNPDQGLDTPTNCEGDKDTSYEVNRKLHEDEQYVHEIWHELGLEDMMEENSDLPTTPSSVSDRVSDQRLRSMSFTYEESGMDPQERARRSIKPPIRSVHR